MLTVAKPFFPLIPLYNAILLKFTICLKFQLTMRPQPDTMLSWQVEAQTVSMFLPIAGFTVER